MKYIIIFSLLFCSFLHAEVVEKIVAIVNDDIITLTDIEKLKKDLKSDGLLDKALIDLYDKKKIISDSDVQLEYLIDSRILDSEVRRLGIVSPIEKVEAEIRKIISENGTSREQLRASLKARGITYADYQNFIKGSLERQTLLSREVASKIKVSDDEIASYFMQNITSTKPLVFEYTLSHILFLNKNEGALSRANAVKNKIASGMSFEAAAAQFSEDPQFSQGGVFGVVRAGDVVPQLEKALSGLRAGDVTAPVAMPDGIHLFKVTKRDLVPSPELEAQRGRISQILFTQAFNKQYKTWIDQRRQASYVRKNQK